MALGGSYYNYVREIPAGANYETWLSVGGWDEKWVRVFFHRLGAILYRSFADSLRLVDRFT